MSVLGDLARVEARIARLDKRCPTVPGGAEGAAFTSLIATPAPVAVAGRRPANVLTLVDARARAHGVDPRLVAAVVEVESGFDANATSPVGAQGLMQLMPATARSLGVANPRDPAENIDGGTRYLRRLLDRFHGDRERALAAYNAGPAAVDRYGGVPPYAETQRYVRRVLGAFERRSRP